MSKGVQIMEILLTIAASIGIILLICLMIYPIMFWFRMFLDCIDRDFKKDVDKLIWMLIIIFGSFLGAILYYYYVKNKK